MNESKIKKTFYDWCIENDRKDLLDRWDYKMNAKKPNEVGFTSDANFYFKCNRHLHKSTPYKIGNITRHSNQAAVECMYCNSFAQWGIDNVDENFLAKYWDYDKNQGVDPWLLPKAARQIIWIKCQEVDYHESYDMKVDSFYSGQRCPFCSSKRIHPKDSFAAYNINRLGDDFLEKYWDYDKNTVDPFSIGPGAYAIKVWIKCQDVDYHGSYDVRPHDFSAGKSNCPYCHMIRVHPLDSLGTKYPEVFDVWSDKNDFSPYDVSPGSNRKAYFKCNCGKHDDYFERIYRVADREFECVHCRIEATTSHLQNKVNQYLKSQSYTYYNEYKCSLLATNPRTGRRLPYDTEVIIDNNSRLIIEVMGGQHYDVCTWHQFVAQRKGTTPEEEFAYIKYRDELKRNYAIEQGYEYLAIPYWTEKDHSYKQLIDEKIHAILSLTQQND